MFTLRLACGHPTSRSFSFTALGLGSRGFKVWASRAMGYGGGGGGGKIAGAKGTAASSISCQPGASESKFRAAIEMFRDSGCACMVHCLQLPSSICP